jgi:hypothetical protein
VRGLLQALYSDTGTSLIHANREHDAPAPAESTLESISPPNHASLAPGITQDSSDVANVDCAGPSPQHTSFWARAFADIMDQDIPPFDTKSEEDDTMTDSTSCTTESWSTHVPNQSGGFHTPALNGLMLRLPPRYERAPMQPTQAAPVVAAFGDACTLSERSELSHVPRGPTSLCSEDLFLLACAQRRMGKQDARSMRDASSRELGGCTGNGDKNEDYEEWEAADKIEYDLWTASMDAWVHAAADVKDFETPCPSRHGGVALKDSETPCPRSLGSVPLDRGGRLTRLWRSIRPSRTAVVPIGIAPDGGTVQTCKPGSTDVQITRMRSNASSKLSSRISAAAHKVASMLCCSVCVLYAPERCRTPPTQGR